MSYITTASGKRIDLPTPKDSQIDIHDIATHLSRMPRFAGATSRFYSVAQHSLVVGYVSAAIVDCHISLDEFPMTVEGAFREGVAHDFHEYITSDVPAPVKSLAGDTWRALENSIDAVIRKRFGLHDKMPRLVHFADRIAFALETMHLRGRKVEDYPGYLTNEVLATMSMIQFNELFKHAQKLVYTDMSHNTSKILLLNELLKIEQWIP